MHPHPHVNSCRKSFLSLFTRKALGLYVEIQDAIIRRHLTSWLAIPGEREVRDACRDMNQMTSQEVFVGPYLDDPEVTAKFSKAYRVMTEAFLVGALKGVVYIDSGDEGGLHVATRQRAGLAVQ